MAEPYCEPFAKGDVVIQCPNCGTADPGMPVCALVSAVKRGDRVQILRTGEKIACQRCACVYNVGQASVWEDRKRPERDDSGRKRDDDEDRGPAGMPPPKTRPPV